MIAGRSIARTSLILFSLSAASPSAMLSQTDGNKAQALQAKAALVLTLEFCSTKMKQKGETFEAGKVACAELPAPLKNAFSNLKVVNGESERGDAQVLLVPKLVSINRTKGITAFSTVNVIVAVEWTVKDSGGEPTVWLETVEGSAAGVGTLGSVKKNRDKATADAMQDVGEKSAQKMSASPELRKLDGNRT